jgi:hypothetical protein
MRHIQEFPSRGCLDKARRRRENPACLMQVIIISLISNLLNLLHRERHTMKHAWKSMLGLTAAATLLYSTALTTNFAAAGSMET